MPADIQKVIIGLVLCGVGLIGPVSAPAQQQRQRRLVRIKDLTHVEGVRANRLEGVGLVAGLNGTGGKSPITRRYMQNFLNRAGGIRADATERLSIADDTRQKTDNLSVVTVTAEVPPFARPGTRVDVSVAAFDDASSLQGGNLLATALWGVDDRVYGMASGAVSVGGFSFGGNAASVQKNHPTVGRVPNGLILEEPIQMRVGGEGLARLVLRHADRETARRIQDAINRVHPLSARVEDPGTVRVRVPGDRLGDVNAFFAEIGALRVIPDVRARVVINEKTGTIIVGEDVRLGRVALTHANLTVLTVENPVASQPQPFAGGDTQVLDRTQVEVTEETSAMNVLGGSATVSDLAQSLNALGVAPRDLSSIFQHLQSAGALHADLEFH